MSLAEAVVRASAWLAPSDCRAEWRREWLAELDAARRHAAGPRPLRLALGAPRHAISLRAAAWSPASMAGDAAFALRGLRHRPGFAAAAILTLALGIGATTGIFSLVYAILLRPLPYRDPGALVQLWETNPNFHWTEANVAPGNLLSWRERTSVFAGIAWYFGSDSRDGGSRDVIASGDGAPTRVRALPVSANFFDVLGAPAATGRTFAPGEDLPGRHHEVILSDAFWRERFGADRAIVGRPILLSGVSYLVVGVMPASFAFDRASADVWLPFAADWNALRETRRPHYLHAVARLKPGVTLDQARADLTRVASQLEREHPATNTKMGAGLGPLDDWFVGPVRQPLLLFLGAVGLVLLIACANVANLFLARLADRAREMRLRTALGASRARLVRQLLVEAGVIAAAGTIGGLGVAWGFVRTFLAMAPPGLPRVSGVGLHPLVFAFAFALAGLTTLLVGVAPAIHATRRSSHGALAAGARTTLAGQGSRRTIVAIEAALAMVLVAATLLTLRSFLAVTRIDPGFPVDGLVTARVTLPPVRYGTAGKPSAFYHAVLDALRHTPGITAAGSTSKLPLDGSLWTAQLWIDGRDGTQGSEIRHKTVSAGYLEALGVRLIAGRTFTDDDRQDTPETTVVNETFARMFFGGANPVGVRIASDAPSPKTEWATIVGVVSDERQDGLASPVKPEVYEAEPQHEWSDMAIAVRSTLPPAQSIARVRDAVHAIDPQLAVFDAAAFTDRVATSTARNRAAVWLCAAFGLSALLLSAIGIYGVSACAVAARTREIGVRLACGAQARDVFGLVLATELRAVAIGAMVGLTAAVFSGRLLASLLFGVPAVDAVSLAGGALLLAAPAFAACALPARRALRVDPVIVLRADL